MKAKLLPDIAYLNECFELSNESSSGVIWKIRPRNHFKNQRGWNIFNALRSGKRVGAVYKNPLRKDTDGTYWQTNLNGKRYLVHRIYYSLLHQINLPENVEIDHIDNNGLRNEKDNVRLSSHAENNWNTKLTIKNTSGFKGLFYRKDRNVWTGYVKVNNKRHSVGCSPSKEVIISLLKDARQKLHGEFTNHGQ